MLLVMVLWRIVYKSLKKLFTKRDMALWEIEYFEDTLYSGKKKNTGLLFSTWGIFSLYPQVSYVPRYPSFINTSRIKIRKVIIVINSV